MKKEENTKCVDKISSIDEVNKRDDRSFVMSLLVKKDGGQELAWQDRFSI